MAKYDHHEFFHHKKPTNYDVVRNMSIKELAEFLMFVEHRFSEFDRRVWLDWLQQEVDT